MKKHKKGLDKKIIAQLTKLVPGMWEGGTNGYLLHSSFADLLVNCIQLDGGWAMVSLGQYHLVKRVAQPIRVVHAFVNPRSQRVDPAGSNGHAQGRGWVRPKARVAFEDANYLRGSLHRWLGELQNARYKRDSSFRMWQRVSPDGKGFSFSGRTEYSDGFLEHIAPHDQIAIAVDLEAYVLSKGEAGASVIYGHPVEDVMVACHDRVSEAEKLDGTYTQEQLRALDSYVFTLLPEQT